MIPDRDLLKISAVVFVVGLASLFVISQTITGNVVAVGEIIENMIGEKVSVSGAVSSLQSGATLTMYLADKTGKIKVVMFSPPPETKELKNGDNVVVAGQINIYRGELEITANSIFKAK